MKKFIVKETGSLVRLVQFAGWKIFHFKGNDEAKVEISDIYEFDSLLERSKLLWGLAPAEFMWCGKELIITGGSLKQQLDKLKIDETIIGILVVPYVDGGLIVISNDQNLKIVDSKPADWWRLHY